MARPRSIGNLFRFLGVPALLVMLALAVMMTRIDGDLTRAKEDRAVLDSIQYGMLNPDTWVAKLSAVFTNRLSNASSDPEAREVLRGALGGILAIVDEVEVTATATASWAKAFLVPFFAQVREQSGDFSNLILKQLEDPENAAQLQAFLSGQVQTAADESFTQLDRRPLEYVYETRACSGRDDCVAKLDQAINASNDEMNLYAFLAALLGLIVVLPAVFDRTPFTSIDLGIVTAALFVMLFIGVTVPMIDIQAEIEVFEMIILGDLMRFENQVLFFQSKSIVDVTEIMIRQGTWDLVLVGIAIAMFSLGFPSAKLLGGMLYLRDVRFLENPVGRFLVLYSGKWSMADVFVVAIFLSFLGFRGLLSSQLDVLESSVETATISTASGTQLGVGFWLFLEFTILSMLLAAKVGRVKESRTTDQREEVIPAVS